MNDYSHDGNTTQDVIAAEMRVHIAADREATRDASGKHAAWLHRHGAEEVEEAVRRCSWREPCLSPSCIFCGPAEQHVLAKAAYALAIEDFEDPLPHIGFLNLVPAWQVIPPGRLHEFDVKRFRRKVKEGLSEAGVLLASGAIDLTLNSHKQGQWPVSWTPTAQLLITADHLDEVRAKLKELFLPTPAIHRPVWIREWDGDEALFPYLFRCDSERRISDDNGKRFNKRTGAWRTCRTTSKERLRVAEKVEFLRFLHHHGLGGRLITRGVRLRWQDYALKFMTAS